MQKNTLDHLYWISASWTRQNRSGWLIYVLDVVLPSHFCRFFFMTPKKGPLKKGVWTSHHSSTVEFDGWAGFQALQLGTCFGLDFTPGWSQRTACWGTSSQRALGTAGGGAMWRQTDGAFWVGMNGGKEVVRFLRLVKTWDIVIFWSVDLSIHMRWPLIFSSFFYLDVGYLYDSVDAPCFFFDIPHLL